jgi:hypothetical protein
LIHTVVLVMQSVDWPGLRIVLELILKQNQSEVSRRLGHVDVLVRIVAAEADTAYLDIILYTFPKIISCHPPFTIRIAEWLYRHSA